MEDVVKKIKQISLEMKYGIDETLKEILLRRVISPLIITIYQLNVTPSLINKLLMLFESNKNFLVVMMLSARFDVFQETLKHIDISGRLESVIAPNMYSLKWLPKILDRIDVKVFYPYLNVGVHNTLKLFSNLNNAILIRYHNPLNTTPSYYINKYIFVHGLSKRCIVIYAQPHFPWLSDIELSLKLYRYVAVHEMVPGDIVNNALKKLRIPKKRVLRAYYLDMILSLKYIKELVEYAKMYHDFDKIIVTGIHGELLGEFGFYFHKDFLLPQLVIVPWYEIIT
jgi:hypothetical protein